MNKKLLLLASISSVLMLGCGSNTPSESDIKENITKSFESCEIVKISNVKKINGKEGNAKNTYFVDFEFDLKFDELDGAKKKNQELKDATDRVSELSQEETNYKNSFNEKVKEIQTNHNNELISFSKDFEINRKNLLPKDYNDLNQALADIEKQKADGIKSITEKYNKILNSEVLDKINEREIKNKKIVDSLNIERLISDLDLMKNQYQKKCNLNNKFAFHVALSNNIDTGNSYLGGEYKIKYTGVRLIKTENGWIFDI